MSEKTITDALLEHTPRLMAIPGVVGTAEGKHDGEPCITILVAKKTAALQAVLPVSLDGYKVETLETGEISAL